MQAQGFGTVTAVGSATVGSATVSVRTRAPGSNGAGSTATTYAVTSAATITVGSGTTQLSSITTGEQVILTVGSASSGGHPVVVSLSARTSPDTSPGGGSGGPLRPERP